MADELTAEKLREELHYDPATGLFTWLKHGWANRVGTVAGGLSDRGYVVIVIAGKLRKAHRLAWLWGRFATAESAQAAYIEEKRRVHAGCTL